MRQSIINLAKEALEEGLNGNDISKCTSKAIEICKTWQDSICSLNPKRFKREQLVSGLKQKIDILDRKLMYAYELKVSGKNADSEFYKDIVKVLIWNSRNGESKIKKLIFITHGINGTRYLEKDMPKAYIKILNEIGIKVEIEYL
jgi:hypothetical protein